MAIPRWKWLEKVGASEEAEKEKAKATPELDRVTDKVESTAPTTTVSSTTRRSSRTRGGIKRGKTTTISPVAQIVDDTKKDIIKLPVTVSDEQKAKIDARLKWADSQSGGAPSILEGTQEVTDTEVQPIKQSSTIMTPDEKLHFIKSVTGHVELGVPEQIKDLGPGATQDYFKTVSRVQMGFIPSDIGQAQLQTIAETRLKEGSLPTSIRWMKEHGTFTSDDEIYTWSELKEKHPRLEIKRESGEFILYETPIDYGAWREEQYEGMHPIAAGIRRGTATLLGGFGSFDYMRAGHTGDPTDITKQQLKLGDIIDKWEYDTIHNIETDNVLGVAADIPAVTNIVLPYTGGILLGKGLKIAGGISEWLKKPVVYTCIGGPTSTGLPYKIFTGTVKVGLATTGAIAIGTAGVDVVQTYQHDPDKALTKALTYGTQFFSFGRGVQLGITPKAPKIEPENRFLFKKGWETESKIKSKNIDKVLKNMFDTTKTKPEKPFFEVIKKGGATTVFKPTTTEFYTPVQTGKTISLTKIKTVTKTPTVIPKTPTVIPKTITISPTMTAKLSFSIMKPISGFKKIKGGTIFGKKIWGRRLSLEMLAASESGVYTGVHPYWSGAIPILKNILKPMTVTIPKYSLDMDVKNLQLQLPQHTSLLDHITSVQTTEVGQINRQTPSFLTDTMIKTDIMSATKNILDIESITESIQKSIQESIQESITETITKTITKFVPEYISVASPSYYYPLSLPSSYVPSGHYKKKKKYLEIDGGRKRVHPVTLLKVPKINFQGINI